MKDSVCIVNTIVYCSLWHETVAFYRDRLNFPVTFNNDWFVEFELNAHARLSVANEQRATVKSAGGQGLTMALKVNNADEIWRQLQSAKIVIGQIKDHPWGGRSFFLHDPEGNRIEIWSS